MKKLLLLFVSIMCVTYSQGQITVGPTKVPKSAKVMDQFTCDIGFTKLPKIAYIKVT